MAENESEKEYSDQPTSPHEGIFFVLAYLPLFEHLVMARVCKSLRDAVRGDIIPGLKLVVDTPLCTRLSDDNLTEIAAKSEGRVQILALVGCHKITDDGLRRFIESNRNITQLYVPGCTKLTPEGVIKSATLLKLKKLRINGIYNIKEHHLKTLHQHINLSNTDTNHHKIFFHDHMKQISALDSTNSNRPIDVSICPKCNEGCMVFDCPRVSCENKKCWACCYCIERCIECGECLRFDDEVGVTACGDLVCSMCWLELMPKCSSCNRPYCGRHDGDWYQHGVSEFYCYVCKPRGRYLVASD